jgi:hypothetical protein
MPTEISLRFRYLKNVESQTTEPVVRFGLAGLEAWSGVAKTVVRLRGLSSIASVLLREKNEFI